MDECKQPGHVNWQVERDAQTLIEAQKIMDDPERAKAAIEEIERILE